MPEQDARLETRPADEPAVTSSKEPDTKPQEDTPRPKVTSSYGLMQALSPTNIGAIYFLLFFFVVFAIWIPNTFLTFGTWKSLLFNQAIVGMVAAGFVIPLVAGGFDLAVGTEVGFSGMLVADILSHHTFGVIPAIAITILAGGTIGLASGLLVVKAKIDSFIATLAMSSVLTAFTIGISGGEQILNLPNSFDNIATAQFLGITAAVWTLLVLTIVIWYVLQRTAIGRRVYATGGNLEAARLAGVRTGRITIVTFACCGLVCAIAGVMLTSSISAGDPTVGPDYLLPALAGVFLGSTQFRWHRVNVAGAVLSIYVLAVGTTGLQLAGAPTWIPSLFDGLALMLAVGLARYERTPGGRFTVIRRVILRVKDSTLEPASGS